MTSISWNDMNDDSSELSNASSDDPPPKAKPAQNTVEQKAKNLVVGTLQKTFSSPQQGLKYSKSQNNDKVAQNLQKLSKHQGSKVWLYIYELPYNETKQNDIVKLLRGLTGVDDVVIGIKGANISINVQNATQLIENGFQSNNFHYKFIYSNRNQNQPIKSGIKKKFSEKYPQAMQDKDKYREREKNKDSDYFDLSRQVKKKYSEKTTSGYLEKEKEKGYKQDQKVQKKKVKYVLKNSEQVQKIQQTPIRLDSIPEKSSQPSFPSESNKYQKQQSSQIKNSQRRQQLQSQQQQSENQTSNKNEKDNESEVSAESKPKKKKKKKKNNKSKAEKKQKPYQDSNNPYSGI